MLENVVLAQFRETGSTVYVFEYSACRNRMSAAGLAGIACLYPTVALFNSSAVLFSFFVIRGGCYEL